MRQEKKLLNVDWHGSAVSRTENVKILGYTFLIKYYFLKVITIFSAISTNPIIF